MVAACAGYGVWRLEFKDGSSLIVSAKSKTAAQRSAGQPALSIRQIGLVNNAGIWEYFKDWV